MTKVGPVEETIAVTWSKKTGLGNSRGEVGGIGQGGELIADIRAGDDHTGGEGGIDAKARANAEERKTDGGGGGREEPHAIPTIAQRMQPTGRNSFGVSRSRP